MAFSFAGDSAETDKVPVIDLETAAARVGNVSLEEATVAVGLAVILVQWFDAGRIQRSS